MANICLATGEDGSVWFEKGMALYPEFCNSTELTREVADYLFKSKRYADFERIVVPGILAQGDSMPTESMLHMAWQWMHILATANRKQEIGEWTLKGLEWNKTQAENIRQHAGTDFMMAYENELKDIAIQANQTELQAGQFKLATATLVAICAIAGMFYMRRKKRNLQFLYKLAEENLRKEKSAEKQLILVASQMPESDTQQSDGDTPNESDIVLLSKLHDFLTTDQRFRNCDLSMENIAQQLFVRQKKLNSMLQTLKGTTLVGYVRDLRMEYACKLLREQPRLKVEAVAIQSGYNTPRQFLRIFKEKYNLTPSGYRHASQSNKLKQTETHIRQTETQNPSAHAT